MGLVFLSKSLCNLSFLFFLVSYANLLYGKTPNLLFSFAVLLAAQIAAYLVLNTWGGKYKYVSLILLPVAFLGAWTVVDYVGLALLCGFTFIVIKGDNYRAEQGDAIDNFKRNAMIMAGLLFFSIVFGIVGRIDGGILPYVIMFMVSGVMQVSLLRHSEETLAQRRFRAFNMTILVLACGLGFFVGTPVFGSFAGFTLLWSYRILVLPVIAAIGMVSFLAVYAVTWFLTNIVYRNASMEMPSLEDFSTGPLNGLVDDRVGVLENAVVNYTVQIIGGILIILVLLYIIKKAVANVQGTSQVAPVETRTRAESQKQTSHEGQLKGVRQQYKRFLQLMHKRGLAVRPSDTSLDVENHLSGQGNKGLAVELRKLYIAVRYGEQEATKEELARAKSIYNEIKKEKTKKLEEK